VPLRTLASPIIPCIGLEARMPRKLCHRIHICPRVEEISDERPSAIMRREVGNSGNARPPLENRVKRFLGRPPRHGHAILLHRQK
jgi:hypothetical protein